MMYQPPFVQCKLFPAGRSFAFAGFMLCLLSFPAASAEFCTGELLRQALAQPVEAVSWKGQTLRLALQRISQSQGVAVMLDRRIDPDQTVEFSASGIPLEAVLEQLAAKYSAAVCQIGPVIYIGPPETTTVLATVVELRRDEVRKLPSAARSRLSKPLPSKIERLAEPLTLLGELENQYELKIAGKDFMPHDLWPQINLPPLSAAEKLSLILAGFHVTFELSPKGNTVRLVAMPKTASLRRTYSAGANAAKLSQQLTTQFPSATIRAVGRKLNIDAPFEVHDAVSRLLHGQGTDTPPPKGGAKNYTLTVENQRVGGVVKALGRQLGKDVVFDVKAQQRLTREISLNLKEVSLDELLNAALAPAGLKYELKGNKIRIFD